ncbi:MAG: ParM/StbA family protein [Bacillota bacterium]|nr:ParM/StbA family protein [Bacillota bacterium]
MRLGIDVGYGFVKGASSAGGRVVFPSVVAKLLDSRRLDLPWVSGQEPRYEVEIEPEGGRAARYAVGDAAYDREGAVRAWRLRGQAEHENTRALLFAAAAALDAGPSDELGLGVPLEVYVGGGAEEWLRVFSGARARVRLGAGPVREVGFSRVIVLPQAAGAYFHAALSLDGLGRDLLRQNVGVVDVGYRTTDLLLMWRYPGMRVSQPDASLSTTLDRGVSWVYERVWAAVQGRLGRPVDPLVVESGFLYGDGVLRYAGEVFDLEGEAAGYCEQFAREIADQVRKRWGDRLERLDVLLVSGGGGGWLYPYLSDLFPGARLAPDALYANALGYQAALGG